jgi:hypothetical protein
VIETALALAVIGWVFWTFRYGGPWHPKDKEQ